MLLANKAESMPRTTTADAFALGGESEGHKDVAELLLANKAEVNAKDNNGWTPLHLAAPKGHKDVAELLLANKAEVNAKDNTAGRLCTAAAMVATRTWRNCCASTAATNKLIWKSSNGQRIFSKIAYYDTTLSKRQRRPDRPAADRQQFDDHACVRILTAPTRDGDPLTEDFPRFILFTETAKPAPEN